MKVYLSGSTSSIRVPCREIALTNGERIRLYDTSGPCTDPEFTVDLKQGLPPLRQPWIHGRNNVEPGAGGRWGLRAKAGRRVTQMHYARRGEITPEMEFVALREGVVARAGARRDRARPRHPPRQHQPSRDGAHDHRAPLPGEDQRQHRQLGGELVHRGRGREDDAGRPAGAPTPSWISPRARTSTRRASGSSGTRPSPSGTVPIYQALEKVRGQGRGTDLGDLPRHAHRAGRAGGRLLHHPRRRAARATSRSPPTA